MNDTLSPVTADRKIEDAVTATYDTETRKENSVGRGNRSSVYIGRLAIDRKTRADAYRLRYRSYLAGGHIAENRSGLFKDEFDDMPNASTVVIYDRDVAVASVRTLTLSRGTDLTSPARKAFPDEVDALLEQDDLGAFAGRAIESTRLVRSPEASNNQGLVFLLYRMAGYIGICAHSQLLLACVRSNHTAFYRRLGYEPASDLRPYPGLNCPMGLMATDRRRYDRSRERFPIMDPLAGTTGNLGGFFQGEPVTLALTRV